ncbi:MAG: hypothetical protein M3336_00250 [Chloroflexota bacterium]|nr:hypothetical protein [Chloroflexota bacterium]
MSRPDRSSGRARAVLARDRNGLPRTYRLASQPAQQAAYRRLAAAILGLDVASLTDELRLARRFSMLRAA